MEKWRNHQHQHRSTEFGEHLWNGHWMHFALVTVNQQVILVLSFSIDRMQALDLSSQVITLLHHPIQSNPIELYSIDESWSFSTFRLFLFVSHAIRTTCKCNTATTSCADSTCYKSVCFFLLCVQFFDFKLNFSK